MTFEAKTTSRCTFYWGVTSRNYTLSAGTAFSGLAGTLCGKDPDQRIFFENFSIWTFEKGRQQCSFYSSRCERMREHELYFTSPWRTARPIIWFNERPFWSIGEGFKSFFSGLRRCKCRSASSDKSLSKNPPSTVEIPQKFSSLARAHYVGLLQIFFHFNIFVFAWAICIINVTDRYGLHISHVNHDPKIILTGYLCIVIW